MAALVTGVFLLYNRRKGQLGDEDRATLKRIEHKIEQQRPAAEVNTPNDLKAEPTPQQAQAIAELRKALETYKAEVTELRTKGKQYEESLEAQLAEADLFLRDAKHKEALGLLQALQKAHPDNLDALNRLGLVQLELANWTQAEAAFRALVKANQAKSRDDTPELATALSNLAQLLKATNRLAEAEPLMRRALWIYREHAPNPLNAQGAETNYAALMARLGRAWQPGDPLEPLDPPNPTE
ncbi:MAG: tetratricopeptide repeat protein [Opitutales bacterium]